MSEIEPIGDLPVGWAWTTIADVTSPSKEKMEPDDCPSARYLSLEHIESQTGEILNSGKASDANSTKAVFQAGDVLYGKLRPYLNKVTIPNFDGICSTDILVFPKTDWLLSVYLRHFLSTRAVVQYANHNSSGIQLPRISFGKLGEWPFPLPPLAEQRRIVAKVETLLARVNAARQRLAKVPALLKRFRQSVLAAACSGQLTEDWRDSQEELESAADLLARIKKLSSKRDEGRPAKRKPNQEKDSSTASDLELFQIPDKWCWERIRGIMDEREAFCYGVVQPGADNNDGVPLIRAGDLEQGTVNSTELRRIPVEVDAEYKRSKVSGGELLVTVVGAGIGTAAIIPVLCKGFNIARAVAKIPVRDFSSKYVLAWLQSSVANQWMKEASREVARPTLNLEQLENLPVPLPPLTEQQEIVRRVEALLARADRIEKQLAAANLRVETLTQAILAQAFRGELVPTEAELARREGRSYETAGNLLERIRLSRALR